VKWGGRGGRTTIVGGAMNLSVREKGRNQSVKRDARKMLGTRERKKKGNCVNKKRKTD